MNPPAEAPSSCACPSGGHDCESACPNREGCALLARPRAWRSRPDRGVTWWLALASFGFGTAVIVHGAGGGSLAWAGDGFLGGVTALRLWQTRPWRRRSPAVSLDELEQARQCEFAAAYFRKDVTGFPAAGPSGTARCNGSPPFRVFWVPPDGTDVP